MKLHAYPELARHHPALLQCFKAGWLLLFCLSLSGCASITLNAVQDGRLVQGGTIAGVELMRQGVRSPAQDNMDLQPGDEIRTDPQTIAVLSFMDGARVFVQPATHLRIGSIFVYLGEVLVKVKGYFQVETRYVTAGSEGTQYLVRVDPGDQLRVAVVEDRVGLASRSQRWNRTILGPGQAARIDGEAPPRVDAKPMSSEEVEDIRRRIDDLDALVPQPANAWPLLGGAMAIGIGIGIGQLLKDQHKDKPESGSGYRRPPPAQNPGPSVQPVPSTVPSRLTPSTEY
jgi:hypothetical protein